MTDVLLHDPTNRKLWDEGTLNLIWYWWMFGIYALIFAIMAYASVAAFPKRLSDKNQYDTLIASGMITEASIVGCYRHNFSFSLIFYEFTPSGGTSRAGSSVYWGDCTHHPAGDSLMIRYLPHNPIQSAGIGQYSSTIAIFYLSIIFIPFALANVYVTGRSFIYGLMLAGKGRVRIGRIVSAKPIRNMACVVRYEVTADDGTVLKGKRVIYHKNLVPELVSGSPIPVLYASKRIHWAFALDPRNAPRNP